MDQSQETGSIIATLGMAAPGLEPAAALEAEVDHAIALCGDPRAALRALILLVRHLEEEARRLSSAVSRGYVRGELYQPLSHADRMADGHSGER